MFKLMWEMQTVSHNLMESPGSKIVMDIGSMKSSGSVSPERPKCSACGIEGRLPKVIWEMKGGM